MKHIDDLFRDGLAGRRGDVPADLWSKIQAAKPTASPEDRFDQHFAEALRDRTAPVPVGMWDRIVAARAASNWRKAYWVAAAVLLLLLGVTAAYLAGEPQAPTLPQPATTIPATAPHAANAPVAANLGVERAELPSNSTPTSEEIGRRSAGAEIGGNSSVGGNPNPSTSFQTENKPQSEAEDVRPDVTDVTNQFQDITPPKAEDLRSDTKPVAQLENLQISLITQEDNDQPLTKLPRKRKAPETIARAPRHQTQTEMLFGAAYANQLLTANSPEDVGLLSARENSEFPELSYQITLRQAYRLTDRVTLRGGLTYVDIRNQFDYEEVIDGQLQLTRRNNHIRMLEVPVLAGLTLPGKRLRVSVNAGPVFNLTTSVQGRYLDPDSPEPLDLATAGRFRTYTGVGYMASLTTTYAVGKRDPFVLVLEPFFKHYPGSFTERGARIREAYWLAGLQLGVRRSL